MSIYLILTFPKTRIADQGAGVWICSSRSSQYGELVSTTPLNNVFLSLWSMNPIILLCTSGHSRMAKRGWFRLQRHLIVVQSPYNIKPKINIRSSIVWKNNSFVVIYVIRSRSYLPFECTWVFPRLLYGLRVAHRFCFLCCVVCFSVLFVFVVFLVCPMFPVSLDCLCRVSCVPNVAGVSGLSLSCFLCAQCCQCLWIVFVVFLVCPMLPVSLDCPFLFPLVFFNDSIRWICKNKWFMSFVFLI
jgi:hypothetical protein